MIPSTLHSIAKFALCSVAALMVGHAARAESTVQLITPRCSGIGQEIVVDVKIGPNAPNVVGCQSAIDYDGSVLQFVSAEAGDAPFDLPIYFLHNPTAHKIDMAVGITPPNGPSTGNVVVKRLRFLVIGSTTDCTPAGLVQFRRDVKVRNLLTDSDGRAILPTLASLDEINLGSTPVVNAPPNIVAPPPIGSMTLFTSVGVVTASGCGPILNLRFARSDGKGSITAGFDRIDSPITITWSVTDECGRVASAQQTVTVDVLFADLNQDNIVDASDLAYVLGSWGATGPTGDLNGDSFVDASDLAIVLGNWGRTRP